MEYELETSFSLTVQLTRWENNGTGMRAMDRTAARYESEAYRWSSLVAVAIAAAAGVFNLLPIVPLSSEAIKVILTILGGLVGATVYLSKLREKAK
jgi:hypothetical protein